MSTAGPPKKRQDLIAADEMHSFRIGDRVRLSTLGEMRNPRKSTKVGTVVSVKLHKSGPAAFLFGLMVERSRAACIGLMLNGSTNRRRAATKMGRGHRGIGWTAEEDTLLRELIAANVSGTLIRARLKRSPEAIRMRLLKLQKRQEKQTDELAPTPELADIPPVNEL